MRRKVALGICFGGQILIIVFLAFAGTFGMIIPSWVMKLYSLFMIVEYLLILYKIKKKKLKTHI